jgi:hypothetical protein
VNTVLSALVSRLRQTAREEDGYLIVEMMVGALVMVMLALGTLQAFDGAAKVGATTKTRAIAASLAQEEQERLRGLTVDQLNRLNTTSSQTIGGITYTINSTSQWLADATTTPSCTSNGKAADYLKTVTTVTPSKSLSKPIVLTSLVTAPQGTFSSSQGTLSVSIVDRNAAGVSGIPVTLTGPSGGSSATYNDTTDSNGCVFYGYLPTGTYSVDYSTTGWVDKDGTNNSPKSNSIVVSSTSNSTANFDYDQAASATVNLVTKAYGSGSNTSASATYINFENPGISGSGRKTFGNGSTYLSTYPNTTVTGLFPFTDNYNVYAGTGGCTGVTTAPSTQILTPGSSPTISVTVPSINTVVQTNTANPGNNGAGTNQSAARVKLTPSGTGCPAAFYQGAGTQTTNSSGRFDHPEAPYGSYNLCADFNFGTSGTPNWRKTTTFKVGATTVSMPVANTAAAGTSTMTAIIYKFAPSSGSNGSSNGQC